MSGYVWSDQILDTTYRIALQKAEGGQLVEIIRGAPRTANCVWKPIPDADAFNKAVQAGYKIRAVHRKNVPSPTPPVVKKRRRTVGRPNAG